MKQPIRIPALRFGFPYDSMSQVPVVDLGSGEILATLGQVRENMIAVDCGLDRKLDNALAILQGIPVKSRIEMSANAANIFRYETLKCGDSSQSYDQYIDLLTRTSGLSHTLAEENTYRICSALRDTEAIMNGLSRGLPLHAFDSGFCNQSGATVRIVPRIKALGACMPNNSPGVNVIWLVSLAFGIPVLIRPGSSEPFTAYRLIQAFIKAGFPPEVFGYYPCDYAAADRIPLLTDGAIVFGSDSTVKKWANHPLVQVHGSGYSKLILGDDVVDEWRELIPEIAINVSSNSGRSCFTVSTIIVPRYGKEIADALAKELSVLKPAPLAEEGNLLSAMTMPDKANATNEAIEAGLAKGATDMSAPFRDGGRLVVFEGRTYMLPTIIYCDSMSHPLAREEFLFPYAAVVEAPNDEAFEKMGPTLSLAVYTRDQELMKRARRSSVSLVSINKPTPVLDRTQPHEENLFELLYKRLSLTSNP